MPLHAVRNIETAFVVTREFLTPISVRRWLKLALVVFFVGGGLSFPSAQFNTSGGSGASGPDGPSNGVPVSDLPFALPVDLVTIVAAIAIAGVVLGALFALVAAIMEFVLVESLRSGEVTVRRYWRGRWRQGVRLFGFRVAIGLPMLALFAGWLAVLFVPLLTGADPLLPVTAFLVGVPLLFLVGALYAVVSGFTTVFVVPLMIQRDSGVLAGWKLLWRSIRSEWKQYLAYLVIGFLLTVAIGLAASIVVGFVVVVLLVPVAVVAVLALVTLSVPSTAVIVAVGGLALLFGAAMVVVWAIVQVPVVTYLRYYALLVLGDIDGSFDLIPDRRPPEDADAGA